MVDFSRYGTKAALCSDPLSDAPSERPRPSGHTLQAIGLARQRSELPRELPEALAEVARIGYEAVKDRHADEWVLSIAHESSSGVVQALVVRIPYFADGSASPGETPEQEFTYSPSHREGRGWRGDLLGEPRRSALSIGREAEARELGS